MVVTIKTGLLFILWLHATSVPPVSGACARHGPVPRKTIFIHLLRSAADVCKVEPRDDTDFFFFFMSGTGKKKKTDDETVTRLLLAGTWEAA